jgi:hypothetical protein
MTYHCYRSLGVLLHDARERGQRSLTHFLGPLSPGPCRVMPVLTPQIGPSPGDLVDVQPGPLPLIDLPQIRVRLDFQAVGFSDSSRCVQRPPKVAGVDGDEVFRSKRACAGCRLRPPLVVEVDVGMTLGALGSVPLCSSVTDQKDACD